MNQYWLIAFITLLALIGFAGYRYGHDATEVGCQQQQELQQQHVITQMQTQTKITNGVEHAYSTGVSSIDDLYRVQSAPHSTMRNLPTTACGTQTSKRYKLTLQQCDKEEFKCIELWNWANQQAGVK